jgi:hypothetical protein
MISVIVLTAFALPQPPLLAPPLLANPLPASTMQDGEATDDHTKEIEALGEDVAGLLELAAAWKEAGKTKEAKSAFARILEIDPEHEEAHRALRHHQYGGKWFKSYAELSRYRREEARRMKEEHGLVRHGEEWVAEADVPYLRMNWTKNDDGVWVSPHDLARQAVETAFLEEKRQQRPEDSVWVHPDDFAKWSEGLWLCGEEWVSAEAANTYHGEIGSWWQMQGDRYVVLSTVELEKLYSVKYWADQTYDDLARIFGVEPDKKPQVVVLKNVAQYNIFAGGDQAAQLPPTEATGFSSLHYAYFADSFYGMGGPDQVPEYLGTGVGYWDYNDPSLAPYGQHAIRHAAGHAYIEAIDPSWVTISEAITGGSPPDQNAFWAEKQIPRWLRYGAATYVGRYFQDRSVGENGNPWWPREWAIANLGGELFPLEDILALNLSLEDLPGSTRKICEAGLVVSFIIDGDCAAVTEKHQAFKAALESGEGIEEALAALQAVLIENEPALRKYAGM